MFGWTRYKYSEAAGSLQRAVMSSERTNLEKGLDDYTEEEVRQATVHTRQDLVLVVSYLSALNTQAATIRRLLWLILAVLAFVALR